MTASHLIVGAGVVGLSIARELAARGLAVEVLESGPGGGTSPGPATPASLGVLTAPVSGASPFQRLQALGHRSYPDLARELLDETGIDVGYRVRGSLHLKAGPLHSSTRAKVERLYRDAGLEARWVEGDELLRLAPCLRGGPFPAALHVSSEAVVDPRELLRALRASAVKRGVVVRDGAGEVRVNGRDAPEVMLPGGDVIRPVAVIVAAGAWSRRVLEGTRLPHLPVRPIRGQAIEVDIGWVECPNLRFDPPGVRREYHVISRGGGRAWIGSTVEDAGFDARVTDEGVAELLEAARCVLPGLSRSDVVSAWVGLRPQALRPGGPFLGRVPGAPSTWVACGHYRSGIMTGPASARLLVREVLGEPAPRGADELEQLGLAAFRVER